MTPFPAASTPAPLRWAFRLWLAVAVAVCVRTLVSPINHTIYPVLAGGTTHWWADRPVYADYKPLDYFRYPPPFAVAFSPFAALGPRAGGVLWSLVGIGVLLLGLWRFLRDAAPADWAPARQGIFLALCAIGALRGLWNAQSNALAVGLLLLGVAALVRRRWWTAAAVLAGSVLVKCTPLAPVLLLCALHPRRLTPRVALFLALGLLAPFLTRSPAVVVGHYREWFDQMAQLGGERWPGFRDGWTVWLVIRQWLSGEAGMPPLREPLHSGVYRGLQLLTAATALLWCLWQRRRMTDPRRLTTVVLAMGVTWLLLFGPATEHATYVFLAPVLSWAFLQSRGGDSRPFVRSRGQGLLGAALVLVLLLGWDSIALVFPSSGPVLLAALPIGATLFAFWLIGYASNEGPGCPEGHPVGPIAASRLAGVLRLRVRPSLTAVARRTTVPTPALAHASPYGPISWPETARSSWFIGHPEPAATD